jgi:hypothetical protein
MKKIFIFVLLLSVSSCTTFQDMDAGLAGYVRKDIHSLIRTIGYPNAQREIAGRKLYIWDTRNNVTFSLPQTSSSTIVGPSGTYTGTSTTMVPHNLNYHCTITVEVNSSEQISSYEWYGNLLGCDRYARALKN